MRKIMSRAGRANTTPARTSTSSKPVAAVLYTSEKKLF